MSGCACNHPGHPDWHNFDCGHGLAVAAPRAGRALALLRRLIAEYDMGLQCDEDDFARWETVLTEARALLAEVDQ